MQCLKRVILLRLQNNQPKRQTWQIQQRQVAILHTTMQSCHNHTLSAVQVFVMAKIQTTQSITVNRQARVRPHLLILHQRQAPRRVKRNQVHRQQVHLQPNLQRQRVMQARAHRLPPQVCQRQTPKRVKPPKVRHRQAIALPQPHLKRRRHPQVHPMPLLPKPTQRSIMNRQKPSLNRSAEHCDQWEL